MLWSHAAGAQHTVLSRVVRNSGLSHALAPCASEAEAAQSERRQHSQDSSQQEIAVDALKAGSCCSMQDACARFGDRTWNKLQKGRI